MIDTSVEEPIPLSVAARETPNRNGGRGVHVATTGRWWQRGVHGVKLETVLIGGIRMTSRPAMARFFAAVTAAADGTPLPSRTPVARQRAIEAAERELES